MPILNRVTVDKELRTQAGLLMADTAQRELEKLAEETALLSRRPGTR